MIAAVVVAAGHATRFGGEKVLAPLAGVPLVRHVVERLVAAGLAPIVVVAGAGGAVLAPALAGTEADIVVAARPDDGMSASLRAGVAALPADVDAFVVALGDQPLIDPAVVRALCEAWRGSNAAAVVPAYGDGRGHPVLFDATLRRRFDALEGDTGARPLLEALGDRVVHVTVDGKGPRDVDTPDDLRALDA